MFAGIAGALLVLPLPALTLRVLTSGRELAEHKPDYSGAELLHSSLAGQDTLTICARFKAFQFTYQGSSDRPYQALLTLGGESLFGSVSMTDEKPHYKSKAGDLWRNGDVALYEFGTLSTVDWTPGVWNSACFGLSISRKLNQVWFNGKMIKSNNIISSLESFVSQGKPLSLMGDPEYGNYSYSFFGAMTDVNIWNRSLSLSEVEQWSRCELESGGNLLDWNTAQWEAVGLQEEETEKDEVCGRNKAKRRLLVFKERRSFNRTVQHCKAMAGEMAVARDNKTLQEIIEAVKPLTEKGPNQCGYKFYSGYTDGWPVNWQERRVWRDVEGEQLAWVRWKEGQPNNYGGYQHCLEFNAETGESNDKKCSQVYCPVCSLAEMTAFHLEGVCQTSSIDRFYVLHSDRRLLGYIQNEMAWSGGRWNILNLITNKVEAYMNDSSDFPFGTHPWYFTDSNCTETGKLWRDLNLHVKYAQPGNFCCGDGMCISSDWRCDGEV